MRANAVQRRVSRLVLAGFIAIAASLVVLQAAKAGPPSPVGLPFQIRVDDTANKVFLVGHALGVQIYQCTGTEWRFVAPRASLFDDNGNLIVKHFGGPSWQANDGSKVVGKVEAGVTVDQTAVPWLKLSIASRTAGPDGGDRLLDTSFIQRINIVGGIAPRASDCTAASTGTVVEVPYTADYVFWKPTGASAG